MIEMTLYGRGGQGGVTLAKLIATAWFLRGKFAQAFGVYAAERSGAPIQAYVRVDDDEITTTNQIRRPDHVIVLDPTLVGDGILSGASPDGWLILNTPLPPSSWPSFRGRRVATIDATAIAVRHGLGTRSVPIVNTTMMGAAARLLDFSFDEVRAAFEVQHFGGANLDAAREAYDAVATLQLEGEPTIVAPKQNRAPIASLLDPEIGAPPAIRTGTWATRRPQRRLLKPPCNAICPAGNDVQRFLAAAAHADYDAALAILLETTPLPGICGRVCPAPCMSACNRIAFDEGVNVREIERFVADAGRPPEPSSPWRAERIAVVGSGPAGISAAYRLARLGYRVSLFEASDELGGVLRNGIPDYRLPKDVLDRELGYVLMHGVNAYVDSFINAAALREMTPRYHAVLVATGLQSQRALDLGDNSSVIQGIDFLDAVHRRTVSMRGNRVVVVGGGNTAIDAARSALRAGAASVRIVYRRSRAEMPAIEEEIEAALHEGVTLDELVLPQRMEHDRLRCVRMLLGDVDASGRRKPFVDPSPAARFEIPCDTVILALGGEADRVITRNVSDSVFFAGDFATNDGTVAGAIGSGWRTAMHIHRSLIADRLIEGDEDDDVPRVATQADLHFDLFEHAPRLEAPIADASQEAQRCLSCGVCNECDRCRDYCPEGILERDDGRVQFDYEYCKGCGLCASECPRGAVVMEEV